MINEVMCDLELNMSPDFVLPESLKKYKSSDEISSMSLNELKLLLFAANNEAVYIDSLLNYGQEHLDEYYDNMRNYSRCTVKGCAKRLLISQKGGSKTQFTVLVWIYLLCLLPLFIYLFFGLTGKTGKAGLPEVLLTLVLALLIYASITAVIVFIMFTSNKSKAEIYKKDADVLYTAVNKCRDSLSSIDKYLVALPLVPKDYRYTLALSNLLKIIENGRSSNWSETCDRFEEQLHRWRLEQNSNEALQYQRYQALMAQEAVSVQRSINANLENIYESVGNIEAYTRFSAYCDFSKVFFG